MIKTSAIRADSDNRTLVILKYEDGEDNENDNNENSDDGNDNEDDDKNKGNYLIM